VSSLIVRRPYPGTQGGSHSRTRGGLRPSPSRGDVMTAEAHQAGRQLPQLEHRPTKSPEVRRFSLRAPTLHEAEVV
jgi:hypothetical protein